MWRCGVPGCHSVMQDALDIGLCSSRWLCARIFFRRSSRGRKFIKPRCSSSGQIALPLKHSRTWPRPRSQPRQGLRCPLAVGAPRKNISPSLTSCEGRPENVSAATRKPLYALGGRSTPAGKMAEELWRKAKIDRAWKQQSHQANK